MRKIQILCLHSPLNTNNRIQTKATTGLIVPLFFFLHSCRNQSRKCSVCSNTMPLPFLSIIKKFRHACILRRGGKQPCLPLQPRWCHLRPHFLTGLEDLTINVLPALSPPSTTTSSQHRPVSRFLPEESPLLQLFPPLLHQPSRKPQRSLPDRFLTVNIILAFFAREEKTNKHRVAIMEMVKKKIRTLQQELDDAEERELTIQRELDTESEQREKVREVALFTLKKIFF